MKKQPAPHKRHVHGLEIIGENISFERGGRPRAGGRLDAAEFCGEVDDRLYGFHIPSISSPV
jgi:hypothetical protein